MTSTSNATLIQHTAQVPPQCTGKRLDQVAAELFPEYSRARLQAWIKSGSLTVDGKSVKPNIKLVGGEDLRLNAQLERQDIWVAEPIALDIIYEDNDVLVLNKRADLVVHPAAGNWSGTVMNGLLHHLPSLAEVPRAGIVHRLDKETTGLMVVAKTLPAQTHLVAQLQNKTVQREYFAIVRGQVPPQGTIEAGMGRHPAVRTKMAVVKSGGKPAVTHFTCIQHFLGLSAVKLRLETGRTHQIRVHMAHLGFPLVGDPLYGKAFTTKDLKNIPRLERAANFKRQALHAKRLAFVHPASQQVLEFKADLPDDLLDLFSYLSGDE